MTLGGVTEAELAQIFPFLIICFQPVNMKMCGHGQRDDVWWCGGLLPTLNLLPSLGHQDLKHLCPREGRLQQHRWVPHHFPPSSWVGRPLGEWDPHSVRSWVKQELLLWRSSGMTPAPSQPVVAKQWAHVQPPADCPRGPTPVRTCFSL